MKDLKSAARVIINGLIANGFPKNNLQEIQVLCLAEEVGEFVGEFRRWKGWARRSSDGDFDKVKKELADVVIAAFCAADALGIDLPVEVEAKLQVVMTRGYRNAPDEPAPSS